MVVTLSPDVRTSRCVEANTRTFSVSSRDDCSGLDLTRCKISLFCLKRSVRKPLSVPTDIRENGFALALDKDLAHGEYFLQISLCDRAENRAEFEYPFVVPEADIMSTTATYEDYNEAKHKELIRSLPAKLGELIGRQDLYVCHYVLHNKAENTYCKDIYISVDNEGAIYSWGEIGGLDYTGVVSLTVPESFDRSFPKNRVFGPQQILRVEEIAPGGHVHFIAMVGFMRDPSLPQEPRRPRKVGIFGTYISEGYGRTTTERVQRWVPIKKLEGAS